MRIFITLILFCCAISGVCAAADERDETWKHTAVPLTCPECGDNFLSPDHGRMTVCMYCALDAAGNAAAVRMDKYAPAFLELTRGWAKLTNPDEVYNTLAYLYIMEIRKSK